MIDRMFQMMVMAAIDPEDDPEPPTPETEDDLIAEGLRVGLWDISEGGIFQNSDGTTAASADDPVGYVPDQWGVNHLIMETPQYRPTLRESGGKAWIEGTGEESLLDAAVDLDPTHTIVIAADISDAPGDTIASLFAYNGTTGDYQFEANSTSAFLGRLNAQGLGFGKPVSTLDISGSVIVSLQLDATAGTATCYVNGALAFQQTGYNGDLHENGMFRLLSNRDGGVYLDADIYYCCVWNGLDARAEIEAIAASKFVVPSAAPDTADAPTLEQGALPGYVRASWTIPADNGSELTKQEVRYSTDESTWTTIDVSPTATYHDYDADQHDTPVYAQVRATNVIGAAASWSGSSEAVVPTADATPTYVGGLTDRTYDEDTGDQTVSLVGVFSGESLTYSLIDPPAGVSLDGTDIDHDTDTMATDVSLTVNVRAENSGGPVDRSYSVTVEADSGAMPLFPEAGLSTLNSGSYDPKDIEGTGDTDGTPTLTAQTDYLDVTPCRISATANWHRVGFDDLAMTSGQPYTFAVSHKDVDAGQWRITLQNDANTEHRLVYNFSTGIMTELGTAWGTRSNLRTSAGGDGTTYVLFDYVPGMAVTAGDCKIGTGMTDGSSVDIYTMSYSEANVVSDTPTKWLAVANASGASPAGHTYGTPSSGNTTIRTTAAAAIAAPLETIQQAVDASTPGTVILVKGNTEASPIQYSGNVTVNASRSGTEGNPLRIVADTYRGVEILGGTGGGEQSAVYLSNAKYVDLHNLVATCRAGSGQDNAAFKVVNSTNEGTIPVNHIGFYGLHAQGTGSGGRDVVKLAAHRDLTMKGCLLEGANFSQSAIDIVTGIDDVIEYNTFSGVNKEGPAFKGASLRMQFRYNLINITQQGSNNSVAGLFGELGESRTGRVMPFDGETFPWAEYHDGTIEYNVFQTDFDECIWFRGASDTVFRYNFLGGHGGSNAIEMKNAPSGMWSDQPTTVPGTYAAYATISGSTVTYECRGITITDNWIETGAGTGIVQQNSGTNTIGSFTAVADYASVPGGVFDDVGEDGFDETAIYTELGLD